MCQVHRCRRDQVYRSIFPVRGLDRCTKSSTFVRPCTPEEARKFHRLPCLSFSKTGWQQQGSKLFFDNSGGILFFFPDPFFREQGIVFPSHQPTWHRTAPARSGVCEIERCGIQGTRIRDQDVLSRNSESNIPSSPAM